MKQKRTRILLVEDDRDLAGGLRDALEFEGYLVTLAEDGRIGLREAMRDRHDLIILDAMLPHMSGFDLLKELRGRSDVRVLILTARGQEIDKVRGFKLGADDYVTKPFGMMELLARVEALLRRGESRPRAPQRLEVEDLLVDFSARSAVRAGKKVDLTAREFEILEILALRRGEAVSRGELLTSLWGVAGDADVSTRTIDQHVAALRRKLGDDAACPHLIETIYGYGYRLASPESA